MKYKQLILLVLLATSLERCYSAFVDYGITVGDTGLGGGDDNTYLVTTTENIKIWKTDQTLFYISSNGVIFPSDHGAITPSWVWQQLPSNSLYVYYADANFDSTCGDCNIYYRTIVSQEDLHKINHLIQKRDGEFVAAPNRILVTTWYKSGGQHHPEKMNTFQAIIASNGTTTYALISYDSLNYYNGTSSRTAKVGFKGTESHVCVFPGSNIDPMKLQCRSNVFVPGLFVVGLTPNSHYQCDNGGNLESSCSHCSGEETWIHANCGHVNASVCGSDGIVYRNQCELKKEMCRTSGSVRDTSCEVKLASATTVYRAGIFPSCDFETDTCGFTGANWFRRSGSTPSVGTGPSVDASGSIYGYYYHLEASGLSAYSIYPVSAQVTNPRRYSAGCLRFAYHMYGSSIGKLAVRLISRRRQTALWQKVGNQGNVWRRTSVSFQLILDPFISSDFNVTFLATKGSSYEGDIAIDEISIVYGSSCASTSTTTSTTTRRSTTVTAGQLSFCDFERNSCGFTLSSRWSRHYGSTSSTSTGPSVDASGSSWRYYIYYEATGGTANSRNSISILTSNSNVRRTGCLQFAYHMYGSDMGSLLVSLANRYRTETIWSRNGNKGDQWNRASVSLNQFLGRSSSPVLNVTFVAVRGTSYQSDIALDDISISFGRDCSSVPTTSTTTRPSTALLYPYGVSQGDRLVPPGDDTVNLYALSKPMKLFSVTRSQIYIAVNGLVSFNKRISSTGLSIPNSNTILGLYTMDLDSSRGGNIYFRETTSQQILSRATADVRKTGATTFTARRALIVSYILVNKYSSSSKHTFQAVITTDETATYAIMNYERLDSRSGVAGYSEDFCNYRKFASSSNISRLTTASNVGRRGRYVYLLTNYACFKPAVGVRTQTIFVYTPQLFGTTSFTFRLGLHHGNTNHGVILLEFISGNRASSAYLTSVTNSNSNLNVGISYTIERSLNYLSLRLQSLFVFKSTKQTARFQHNSVNLTRFSTGIMCQAYPFPSQMSSIPVIAATANIGQQSYYTTRHVSLWLRNVSSNGFDICAKESVAFSGFRNISVNYIAVTGRSNNITEYGKLNFTKHKDSTCQNVTFQYIYSANPSVFTTPEEVEGEVKKDAIISWVKIITTKYVEICAKHSADTSTLRKTDVKVNYIVTGAIDQCSYFNCPNHLECRKDFRNRPYCGCIRTCYGRADAFCGNDFVTYVSRCQLDKSHCERYGNNTRHNVTIAHPGKCERFPYQAGVSQLDVVPGAPTVFCRYIPLTLNNFHPTIKLSIQLSISWDQNTLNNISHDATASWSEDITNTGFKACAMVAGRHFFERFDKNPTVHWIAYQAGLDGPDIELGVINMPTWYTGTRCTRVGLRRHLTTTQLLVSVEHAHRSTFKNAMTAWSEGSQYYNMKICARELQNFDGVHSGIRLHWIAIHKALPPFITKKFELTFSRRSNVFSNSTPVFCKKVEYNQGFPALANPTVIISAAVPVFSYSSNSINDVAAWIEYTGKVHMKICYKAIQNNHFIEQVKISYTIFPALCEPGWIYIKGNCYKPVTGCRNFNTAKQHCHSIAASLPTVEGPVEAYYLEQTSVSNKTWIGLTDVTAERNWTWSSGATSAYRKWLPNRPDGGAQENCAVVDGTSNVAGWDDVSCVECANVQCEKDARLEARSCEYLCLNGGSCTKSRNNQYFCVCPTGFAGKRCDVNISSIAECHNYALHRELWRLNESRAVQSNGISCDARTLKDGWHRFDVGLGTKVLGNCTNSPNRCGTRSPGWMQGSHPTIDDGIVSRILHFYSHYCADDHGEVLVRNCGHFYTYRFVNIPYWSCQFGICLTV